jgi:hypothetical protein
MAKMEKLLDQAREHLDEGEVVLAAVKGTYETKKMGGVGLRSRRATPSGRVVCFSLPESSRSVPSSPVVAPGCGYSDGRHARTCSRQAAP